MAIAGHASNRQFEAETKAKIWSSKQGSFGEKLGADVVTSVYVGLADAIYDALAIGSKKVEAYAIDFSNPTLLTMDAVIGYEKVKETTIGNYTTMNDITNVNHFVKWEESDSVIFISQNGKPVFAGQTLSKDSPLLDDYKAIKKKYSFWQPKYLIPSVIGIGVGSYCIGHSISLMSSSIKEDSNKKITQGLVWGCVGGGVLGGVLGYILDTKISWGRKNAYKEINKRSMERMKKKANSLSVQPTLNPLYNAVGMDVSVTF